MMKKSRLPLACLLALVLFGCGPAPIAPAPGAKTVSAPISADMSSSEWAVFGHDASGAQFSPVGQINRTNVGQLKLAWEHHSGDFKIGPNVRTGTSLEVTPIYVNHSLYYCTPMNRVFALDPLSGKTRWIFDPYAKGADGKPVVTQGKPMGVCRGVAYWQASNASAAPCAKRIFRADSQARLFAIDADTGRSCRDFGPAKHPGYVSHYDFDNFGNGPAGVSSAPTVIGDIVIIGGVANDGQQDANDGIVRAFDVRTGALRWQFDPIPPAYRHRTGAANVWAGITVDPKNNLVFLPTTSPSTDYYGGARAYEMPLTDAVVALHADTGAVAWSYQVIRHDLWDYDLPNHPVLVTIRKDGQPRDVVIQVSKTGYLYVLDRLTGRPVFPMDERPADVSPLPDDKAAPTQPVPRLPQPFARTALKRSDMFGVLGLDKLWCQHAFETSRYHGLFTAPSLQPYIEMPSTLGGGNWGGAAFDPATNTIIVKASNIATRLHFVRKDPKAPVQPSIDFMTRPLDGPYSIVGDWFLSPLGVPCTPPPYGQLTAIAMDTGKIRWSIPIGQTHRYGVTVPAFMRWGSPSVGGPIVTGGGVVFIGGTMDSRLRALDSGTGRELWQAKLPVPGMATPMTYIAGGRQFVIIAAGGSAIVGTRQGDAIMAFALPSS